MSANSSGASFAAIAGTSSVSVSDPDIGYINDIRVVVRDAPVPTQGWMPLRGADVPVPGHGDVVDAQEALNLVGQQGRGHVEFQAFERREQGPPAHDRAGPLAPWAQNSVMWDEGAGLFGSRNACYRTIRSG